ncbi:hydroxyethylthiazole kinase-like uncharacterized protein yjeF [Pedobacter sp. CAN_A7]|uniref:NAD(P)H-hydrate dehydratase n=1 Tax=Pedobacter sp. CAN_A7 TaxID=2787722 RepID=UPI001A2EEEC5
MQTLLSSEQMRNADDYTIAQQQISSIDLMERAAAAFVRAFILHVPNLQTRISIFCGKGNNGGDGLVITRLLYQQGYPDLQVFIANFSDKASPDFIQNERRLQETGLVAKTLVEPGQFQNLQTEVIIDALLGSGLNQPLSGKFLSLVQQINALNKKIYAVDVPTGFFADGAMPLTYEGIQAYLTICFQRPKPNFFFPESAKATDRFEVVDIGLEETFIEEQQGEFLLVGVDDIKALHQPRKSFSHKGSFGHALLIAGDTNTMGAAILNAKGCLYAGAGLTTLSIPASGLSTLNTAIPEVMYLDRADIREKNMAKYHAIGMGSGLGTSTAAKALLELVLDLHRPLVLDADALNLMANYPALRHNLAPGCILTPHVKEFDRLFGEHLSWYDRLATARVQAQRLKCVIVLKNRYTFIVDGGKQVYINPTGNPGMAQGGMGDVLTGVLTAFMAQGKTALESALLACYFHGKAGDDLADDHYNVTASQVAENIPLITRHLICS